jgi:hypothetical protein
VFSLLDPASVATLADSVLTIGVTSDQSERSMFFRVMATDAAGRRDTSRFHVVDPSKPPGPLLGVGPKPAALQLKLAVAPNPASKGVEIRLEVPAGAAVELEIVDIAGRLIRRWRVPGTIPGNAVVTWDGRETSARPVPPGIYIVTARADGLARSVRLALVEH